MKPNILLIDDDEEDRFLFCEALEKASPGIHANAEGNPVEALNKMCYNQMPVPDLIFLDIHMPLMTGWNCLSMIRKIKGYENVPVIMYSTYFTEDDIQVAHNAGALCFFSKPNSFSDLVKSLEKVIQHLRQSTLQNLVEECGDFHVPVQKRVC